MALHGVYVGAFPLYPLRLAHAARAGYRGGGTRYRETGIAAIALSRRVAA